ncbi:D-alanine--D-alanine ligase [Antarcticirhabdus aurantiaca]|uniref:D-alanine--D-alanine ligase n=1 Tax=Antarcticirhabdus aurantiaca TaxID=2606717 RepID=A0ACD4NIB2_9HYPH|nr:D-alanine--D-alanine ligase [Antarcticirhabdus aurantiaca]WAJ26524.1 D-alanine--D-alanine ligase [Jeongeuplla avenae]
MTRHVAVLMGGFSSERPVSLKSGAACAETLEGAGFRVTRVDVDRDIAARLAELKPDVAFNALHGPYGEDGTIQGILEFLSIPYTHSGVRASALSMDKARAKILAGAAGVPLAESKLVDRLEAAKAHVFETPYVLKPVAEGSSFGVFIVREDHAHPPQELNAHDWRFGETLLAERYVAGRELTCAVMGDRSIGVCEIKSNANEFYDYDSKYAPGGSTHIVPADLPADVYARVEAAAVAAHKAMGCRGVSRSDFRYDDAKGPEAGLAWLEINTQPGMTATSLVPDIAKAAGISFADLLTWMVEDASCAR